MPEIFAWLAEFLGAEFRPYEWKLRADSGHLQKKSRGDCAIYAATHAMCLAFGYGITDAFPPDHQERMLDRRRRYVQDLMYEGFADFEAGSENLQYYPLLDTKPEALRSDGFYTLPRSVLKKLPPAVANKRRCYRNCPSKMMLTKHCVRNARFYPGYNDPKVSGRAVTLEEFVTWVEAMDAKRQCTTHTDKERPRPYPQHVPFRWYGRPVLEKCNVAHK